MLRWRLLYDHEHEQEHEDEPKTAVRRRLSIGGKPAVAPMRLNARMARLAPFRSFFPLIRTRSCARTTQHAGPAIQARVPQNADR
jgi:hypothetical protein